MNTIAGKVGIVVSVVGLVAVLSATGYLVNVAAQSFGPDNNEEPKSNRPANNVVQREGEKGPPIPQGESVWEDYAEKDLDNLKRLADRPGNFDVVTLIGQFYEGRYQVEPQYAPLSFPFRVDSRLFKSREEWAQANATGIKERRESGRKKKNKLRQFNVVIHRVTLLNFSGTDSAIPNAADLGLQQHSVDRFAEVRKDHTGRCVLALLRVGFESLQSEKIEGNISDSDDILCWSLKEDGWKLVWFEK